MASFGRRTSAVFAPEATSCVELPTTFQTLPVVCAAESSVAERKEQEQAMQSRNARLGIKLFTVYLLLYAGFVGINTFSTQTMEMTPFAGINLAIWYGFTLILAAVVLALLYGYLCDAQDNSNSPNDSVVAQKSPDQSDQKEQV